MFVVVKLDRLLIVKDGLGLLERDSMFPAIRLRFSSIPKELDSAHTDIVTTRLAGCNRKFGIPASAAMAGAAPKDEYVFIDSIRVIRGPLQVRPKCQ
jgi:hypothetical protein